MTEVTRMRWHAFQNIPKIFSKVLFKTLNSNMSYVPEAESTSTLPTALVV